MMMLILMGFIMALAIGLFAVQVHFERKLRQKRR
jgi:hypothetical protein